MHIKLIQSQIRLLKSRLIFSKFTHSFNSSSRPIFCKTFPSKLNYSGSFHNFSTTRPFRPGSVFSRGSDRGEIIRTSKSLVEDEAELSDWVSELKPDSFRGLLTSDEENEDLNRRRRSFPKEDDDTDSFTKLKRRREGDSGKFGDTRRENGFSSKSKRGDEGGFEDGDDGGFYSRRNDRGGSSSFGSKRGGLSSRGGKESIFGNRRDLVEDKDDSFYSRRGDGLRGGRDSNIGRRRDDHVRKEDQLFSGRNNQGESQLGSSSFNTRKGGKESSNVYRPDQGGLVSVKQPSLISEDEDDDVDDEEGKSVNIFKGLTGEDDSEDEDKDVIEYVSEDKKEYVNDDEDEDDGIMKKNGSSLFGMGKDASAKISPKKSPGQNDSYLSETRFDQCSISPLSLKGVKDAGYEKMTMVQEATLPVILKGKDVLAKAKTGTGKTVAFLLPSIEVVVKSPPVVLDQKRPPIYALIICPTRELANQAAAEANKLLKYHPSLGVQVVIGGTRLALEQKRIKANPCQILVATPGRLKDHIENTAGFATKMMGVKVLVLDEADHLLDMGFRKDIEKIIAAVPKQRQTLLFSATVSAEVRQICHIALKRDHEFINAVQEGSAETHTQVKQMHLVAPLDKHFSLLYALLREHISDDPDYKVLVFCTTAWVTRLIADLLGELNLNVREIHSRKPQSYRTRVSDEFRKSKGLILVTSDVSARGVDYPDVTLVTQVGVPSGREQYIHRLGRTGRKGKEGQGILLLAPWEEYFLSSIKDLPITKAPVPVVDPDTRKKVERALSQTDVKNKEAAYQSWLGYYNSVKNVGKDKYKLVELANDFSRSMGLDNPPAIPKLVLGKMGLKNIPGLRTK